LGIHLLGSPHIEYENRPINVDRRKALALLAYITVTRENHRRDSLVNLLWPEHSQNRGRTNLRQTLYALQQSLNGDWLQVDREEIGLNPEANIWLDVDQFRENLSACETHNHPSSSYCPDCIAPLTSAVGLYRGDFMNGFSLKDSLDFDEWQLLTADRLRGEFVDALEKLVNCYCDKQEYNLAINFAKQWLTIDSLNEAVHCHLMQLYSWSGQRSAVVQQYHNCVRILQDELGLSPQPSTTMLYESIIEGDISTSKPFPAMDSLESHPVVPIFPAQKSPVLIDQVNIEESAKSIFVARQPEMGKLNNYLDRVLDGQSLPVFVTGGAGQGKTVLMQEFTRRAQERVPDLFCWLPAVSATLKPESEIHICHFVRFSAF